MAILEGYKANFEILKRACKNGDLALMECQDKATQKTVIAICAVGKEKGEYVFSPVAKMFDGNPYEELNPPTPTGGGFVDTGKPDSTWETPKQRRKNRP